MISYINTEVRQSTNQSFNIPTDESIGGILFDISCFENPFEQYPVLYNNFKNNTVHCIHSMDEAKAIGIDDNGFLNGVLYYHLSQFYQYIGTTKELYIALADCSEGFDVVQEMHMKTNGKMFQIGVWTARPIWKRNSDASIGFTEIITDLQRQADDICGVIGEMTYTTTPVSFVLSGNTNYIDGEEFSYKSIPNAMILGCPKVSVLLVQNGDDTVRAIQARNPMQATVGAIGVAMACLSICGAEESIASVKKCDLNKREGFRSPELGFSKDYTPINNINRIWKNVIASLGYIIPVSYEGIESSYFFSSDQTLSDGDYKSIANNRVMHKCRRAVCTALIPYINSHHVYDPVTKNISISSKSIIINSLVTIIDSVMHNTNGKEQINGRVVEILDDKDLLEENAISIKVSINPANYSDFIEEIIAHSA